jgi:hypothetical protein
MRAQLKDALEFLYTDSQPAGRPAAPPVLDVALGGTASVQVLADGLTPGRPVRLTLLAKGRSVGKADWFRLVDVPVEKNTGPVGFIEHDGEHNAHVTRRAPFRVFDAMEPVRETVTPSAPLLALRLHVAAGKAGKQDYTIRLESGSDRVELPFSVTVHPVRITPTGPRSLPYTNWFNFGMMATRHQVAPWSAGHWRMIKRYAALMAHARQNTFWLPLGDLFSKDPLPVLNRPRLRRLVNIFTDAGLHFIEGGHLANRTGGEWSATSFSIVISNALATAPEGNKALANLASQLMEEIDRNGWRDRWIQHVTDEPISCNAVDYRILVGMVRRHMPGLPILDATMDPKLVGSVDIWCPQAQEYQLHREEFEAQRALGDRIWFYTCCFPGGPWLNRLMDMELLRPALLGWGAAHFQLDGFLHWGLNHYKEEQDPFQQSVASHGGTNFLPAGDTHIVYPGKGGPWSSVRLEAQREGFEDYELLRLLRARSPKRAERLIGRVFQAFDRYTKDTAVLRKARRELLTALSA